MWRNYVTVGFRSLTKNRAYAVINILGLAIGMAACLMILMFVRYELGYDKWLPNHENVYQLQGWYVNPETGEEDRLQMSPYVAGELMAKDFPQIERKVYFSQTQPVLIERGEAITLEDFVFTDGNLLEVLELPIVHGRREALARPGTAALSQSEARRRFGTENAVGRTFTVVARGRDYPLQVVAVYRDLPRDSHFSAATIARLNWQEFNADSPNNLTCWGCNSGYNYLRLKPGTDPATITAQMQAWEKRNIPDQGTGGTRFNIGDISEFKLVPVADVHLGPAQWAAITPGNDRQSITTFAVIAVLILGMAVVNFTNLATARASQRAREVALRKVLGANRRQLIVQFVGESVLVATLAMAIALAMVELATPAFARFLEADISVRYWGADGIALPIVALVAVVGILGGLYPAFFLSRFQPASVLKANKSAAETPGTGRLRQALVVGQFAVSIGLIICTAVVYGQTVYARTVDPGFARDHILQVDQLSRSQLNGKREQLVEAVRRVPGVRAVGRTDIGVSTRNENNTGVLVPGRTDLTLIGFYSVDTGFLDAAGMTLVAGRWFDDAREMDEFTVEFDTPPEEQALLAARGVNIVVNELAAARLGYRDPAAIIGKTFGAGLVDDEHGLVPATVIGVVKDARFRSVRRPIEPIMFLKNRGGVQTNMLVKFDGDPAAVREGVRQAWRSIVTDVPFSAEFSEDIVQELYDAEESRATIFAAFAVLAVIVGCLGLFGLATFTAERRTKEIGIRKVLGARTRDIVRLLVWQFTRPVIVANLIAWPVAWWLMRDWLNGFDARITLGPTPFVVAGGIALAIAIGTIAGHAIRVASANPIHALRYE